MAWYEITLILVGIIVGLMALGVPVAFAFIASNIVGVMLFMGGWIGILQLIDNMTSMVTTFSLIPVPLFILMGALFFHTGLALRVFDALDACFGQIPGRLCYITVAGGAAFATLTGSSVSNASMLGALMVPEMTARGYNRQMSIGPVIGSGGLAMIIPPSTLAVILGTIARLDIGLVLIAGLLPGLILAVLYCFAIYVQVKVNPAGAPTYTVDRPPLRTALWLLLTNVLPMGLVVFCVVGFIILGITTPSEAAAFGVVAVVILAAVFRALTVHAIRESLFAAARVAAMAFLIVMGSSTFSQVLAFSGASAGLLRWTTSADMAPMVLLLVMFCVLIVLGMFMDQLSMLLIAVPIFFPLITPLGFDPIWFAIIILLAAEMSLSTPPFGLLLFVMLGISPSGTKMRDVVLAALPYLGCDLILVLLLIAFPMIALHLPGLMVQ